MNAADLWQIIDDANAWTGLVWFIEPLNDHRASLAASNQRRVDIISSATTQ